MGILERHSALFLIDSVFENAPLAPAFVFARAYGTKPGRRLVRTEEELELSSVL